MLTKEKIDKQLSGQRGTTTPLMKVGDVPHSSKKVSFNAQNSIREQLESLTSMMYNMSIQKEENNIPFKPKIYQKRGRGQGRQNFCNRNRSFSRDKDKTLRPNYRGQLDARIIITIKVIVEIEEDKTSGEASIMTIGISRTRERNLTPRGNDRWYDSPYMNSGTRSRSNSRVTTNRYRIRCFKCREYDHFANEWPNVGTDDSDGHESELLCN